jgi:serine/threonine protein kinase
LTTDILFQLILDLHASNFIIGFDRTRVTVDQLIANTVKVEDPETYFDERKVDSRTERIYISEPLSFADGGSFILEDMSVKIADFGCGSFICEVFWSAAGFTEDDEHTQKTRGYGAETIVAPEVIFGLGWDSKADVWSVGASVTINSIRVNVHHRSLSCSPIKHLSSRRLAERNRFSGTW